MVLGFAANQVGSGLALTIFGLGLSGLIGAPFVGARRDPVAPVNIPGLTDLPVVGRLFFGQDLFVYASILLTVAGRPLPQPNPRRPRSCAPSARTTPPPTRSGLPVLKARFLAILFGGACAGLAGPICRLSTPASGRPA